MMVDGIYDFITGLAKLLTSIINIITETFTAAVDILGDIPDYIATIMLYLDILPGEAKVFALMMMHILIIFTVIKIINLVVPFM